MGVWRRTVASGLITLIPILVCAYPIAWLYWQLLQLPLLREIQPPFVRVLLILLVFGLWVMSVGYLMRTTLGRIVDREIDALMDRFPVIRLIHTSVKGVIKTVILRRDVTRMPVKVEAWSNVYLTAFRTGNWTSDGREVVFVPGAPDVTSGFVVEMKPEDVIETDETLMEAFVRLVSCGFGEANDRHGSQKLVGTSETSIHGDRGR